MSLSLEHNKLYHYYKAHIAPTLTQHGHGSFKTAKIPCGINSRKLAELKSYVEADFRKEVNGNGRKGDIVVQLNSTGTAVEINLDGSVRQTQTSRKGRRRPRVTA